MDAEFLRLIGTLFVVLLAFVLGARWWGEHSSADDPDDKSNLW